MALVLGLFRGLRVAGRVLEHRHQSRGALVRPAVRNHDVSVCRDDPFPWSAARPHNRIIWTIVFREMSFGGAAGFLREMRGTDGAGQRRAR